MTNTRSLVIGVAVGTALGLVANAAGDGAPWVTLVVEHVARPLGQLFLRLLFMLVLPLVFFALSAAVSDLPVRRLGRMGVKTFGYAAVMSLVAVSIGLFLVNTLRPGAGGGFDAAALQAPVQARPALPDGTPAAMVVQVIPDNIFRAATQGDVLGVVIFALVFGIALGATPGAAAERLKEVLQGAYEVLGRCIGGVLWLAPVGVGALLFTTTATLGWTPLKQVGAYVGVVLLALGLHQFGVYSLSVRFLGGRRPLQFFKDVRLAMTTAFSTASSTATLPTALKVADENLRLPSHVSRFVLVAGSTLNQNGTALFEGVTVLFLAQVAGVELGLGQQALVMGICVLAGIGTAGVPAASLPVIAMILSMLRIPPEGLALVLGVDRLLDMCRTTLNVTGDLAAAVYVAKSEPAEG